jgi:hypothetical protein
LRSREDRNPAIAIVGYTLLGLIAGGISLLIFPRSFISDSKYHGASLVIVPLLGGLMMTIITLINRRSGKLTLEIDTFLNGFIFALGMSVIRFLFTK